MPDVTELITVLRLSNSDVTVLITVLRLSNSQIFNKNQKFRLKIKIYRQIQEINNTFFANFIRALFDKIDITF